MFDYHVHTSFSADSEMLMEEACRQAIQLGYQEIAFTEHIDLFYPLSDLNWGFEYAQYAQSIAKMRMLFDSSLTVLKGIEVGLHPLAFEQSKKFTTENEFDFIIGSIHVADDKDLHYGDFFAGKSRDEAITNYFQTVNNCVKNYRDFNVLGHLDLVKRYHYHMGCEVNEINWNLYDDYIVDTLKHLAETGRGIEVNMSGYYGGINCSMPDLRILKLYRQAGGEIITIGSDAHSKERIGTKFDLAIEMLEAAGFKYLTTYRKREPKFIPLSDIRSIGR